MLKKCFYIINEAKGTLFKSGFVLLMLLFGYIFEYGTRIIIARYLGPEGLGIISFGFSVMMLAALVGLSGVPPLLTREISYFSSQNKKPSQKGFLSASYKLVAFTTVIIVCLLCITFVFNGELTTNLKYFIFSIPFVVLLRLAVNTFRGYQQHNKAVFFQEFVSRGSRLLLVILALVFLGDIESVSAAFLISFIFTNVIIYFIFISITSHLRGVEEEHYSIKDLLLQSLPLIGSAFAMQGVGKVETIILGIYDSPASVGLFNAALSIAQLQMIVMAAVLYPFVPTLTKMVAEGKEELIQDYVNKHIMTLLLVGSFGFIIGVLFPEQLLGIFFGKEFASADVALMLLMFSYLLLITSMPYGNSLIVFKEGKNYLKATASGMGAIVLGCILLIPAYGIIGAAFSNVLGLLVMAVLNRFFYHRSYQKLIRKKKEGDVT